MKQFITYLKDIFNSNYLGINIQKTEINNFLDQLKDLIGDRYSEYTTNQQNRDNGKFHLVVLNVIEYNELSKKIGLSEFTNTVDKVLKFPITDLKLMGLGKSEKSGNTWTICRNTRSASPPGNGARAPAPHWRRFTTASSIPAPSG